MAFKVLDTVKVYRGEHKGTVGLIVFNNCAPNTALVHTTNGKKIKIKKSDLSFLREEITYIAEIGAADAYHKNKDEIVGLTGVVTGKCVPYPNGYSGCDFTSDDGEPFCFFNVKLKTLSPTWKR